MTYLDGEWEFERKLNGSRFGVQILTGLKLVSYTNGAMVKEAVRWGVEKRGSKRHGPMMGCMHGRLKPSDVAP